MPVALSDRLLRAEARLAMLEDRLGDLRAKIRDGVRAIMATAFLLVLYAVIRFVDNILSRGVR